MPFSTMRTKEDTQIIYGIVPMVFAARNNHTSKAVNAISSVIYVKVQI
jgi:hypothetical protein